MYRESPTAATGIDTTSCGRYVCAVSIPTLRRTVGPALLAVTLCPASGAAQAPRPQVVILTTGGTIASRTDAPSIEGPALVQAVPELLDHATITVEEIARTGSSRLTPTHWLTIGHRINELFRTNPRLAGVVVTHGTDTMEETAYFLHLVVRDRRPVVMVGSMRSADAISADGPANLLNAVRVAVDPEAAGRGVLLVMNDEIHGARDVWKTDNQRVDTFRSPEHGNIGYADPDTVLFYRTPSSRHTAQSEFEITGLDGLPLVPIVSDFAGFDGSTIREWADKGAAGIVVETFAGGRMSQGAFDVITAMVAEHVPVVVASRVPGGRIPGPPLVPGSILARDLPAHKARVLLMLALAAGEDHDAMARTFATY